MEEKISNIVSQEAFDQLVKLGQMLRENTDTMDELISKAGEFRKALDSATTVNQMSAAVGNLSNATEQLAQTESSRLNIEREIKAEGRKMVEALKDEDRAFDAARAAMDQMRMSAEETAARYIRLEMSMKSNQNALKALQKEYAKGGQKEHQRLTDEDAASMQALTIKIQEQKVGLSELMVQMKENAKLEFFGQNGYNTMDEMNALLGKMRDTYRSLSEEERENAEIGGAMAQAINILDERLKGLDKSIGNNQRNVGNYDILLERVTNGEVSLRSVMMEMRKSLSSLQVQRDQMKDSIRAQADEVERLAAEESTESENYRTASSRLADMRSKYDELQGSIEEVTEQTAEFNKMQKVQMAEINAETDPNAGINALSQGFGLLANSYQGALAAIALFGGESNELKNTLAKVMIAQQALNAVQQVANDLKKTSLVRIKAEAAWQKIKLAVTRQTTAEEVKNAAATQGAAVANAELAAGEVAATGAAGGLKVAIKAVGTAIKSVPVIGWVLAAAAALTTIITLVVKANRESKKGSDIQQQMAASMQKVSDAQKEAYSATSKNIVVLDASIERLNKCEKGSKQWKDQVKNVADQLGVSNTWLENNVSQVRNLRDAWVDMQIALAMADAYASGIADNTTKMITLQSTLNKIVSTTEYKDRVDAVVEELGVSRQLAENYVKARNAYDKADPSKVGLKKGAYDQMINAQNAIYESLKNQNNVLKNELTNSYKKAADAQQLFADTAPSDSPSPKAGENTTAEDLAKKAEDARRIIMENNRALEDMYLKSQQKLIADEAATLEERRDLRLEYEDDYRDIMVGRLNEEKRMKIAALEDGSAEYISTEKFYDTQIEDLNRQRDANILKINEDYAYELEEANKSANEAMIAADMEAARIQHEAFMQKMEENRQLKESYMSLGEAVGGAFLEIGNALADGVEDSVKQTKIQQALAMGQVLLSQGVALAKAIEAGTKEGASKGSVVAMYAAIATAVGAVIAQIITAKNAIKEANRSVAEAEAYAEGTDYHRGGAAVVGEGGSPELVMAGGRSYVVDRPTFIRDLPVGSKVIPLTDRLSTQHTVDLTKIEDGISGLMGKSVVNINVSDRIVTLLSKGQSRTQILNRQFKH